MYAEIIYLQVSVKNKYHCRRYGLHNTIWLKSPPTTSIHPSIHLIDTRHYHALTFYTTRHCTTRHDTKRHAHTARQKHGSRPSSHLMKGYKAASTPAKTSDIVTRISVCFGMISLRTGQAKQTSRVQESQYSTVQHSTYKHAPPPPTDYSMLT